MSKRRIRIKKHGDKKQVIRTLKQKLVLLITFLITIALILIFQLGGVLWPIWILEHRIPIAGIIIFVVLFLVLMSPIIIEVEINPRPLSGPGKNPKGPNLP